MVYSRSKHMISCLYYDIYAINFTSISYQFNSSIKTNFYCSRMKITVSYFKLSQYQPWLYYICSLMIISLCPVMAAVIVQMTICYRVSLYICPVMSAVFVQTICYRVSLCPVMSAVFVLTICYRVSLCPVIAVVFFQTIHCSVTPCPVASNQWQ